MPSSALVRQVLAGRGRVESGMLRAALALAVAIAEGSRMQREVADGPGGIAELADRTGLTPAEVAGARDLLREAGALAGTDPALRIDPDLCCTLPALAAVDWAACRSAVERAGGRMAPALAVVREVARLSEMALDGGGEWITLAVQELVDETLYGRTAVTQALGDLVRAGMLLRAEQPNRKGLKIRLHPTALGGGESVQIGGSATGAEGASRPAAQPRAVAGVRVEVGGASLLLPPGSRLRLPQGLDYRLEIGPEGGAIVRIDD